VPSGRYFRQKVFGSPDTDGCYEFPPEIPSVRELTVMKVADPAKFEQLRANHYKL
jgi:hypothetical protein